MTRHKYAYLANYICIFFKINFIFLIILVFFSFKYFIGVL